MFSVILNSYDPTQWQRHMTMACLAAIRKFTDMPYEIIVVDNVPKYRIRDEYEVLEPYTLIENKKNQTVYHCYNQGAEAAKYDKIFFIQNDVYVHERTLNKLADYLDNFEMVFPQQAPISREDVKRVYGVSPPELTHIGWRDAGLIGMTKDAFTRSGGWDDRFKNLLGEKAFYYRCDEAGVSWTDRTNAFITHIMAGNNLSKKKGLYDDQMDHDMALIEAHYA